ncbi:hypothetical protein DCC35_05675 [Mangrovivirga cuniculi]|uniref:Uncharacterized protein n=1 Tax=Mangrovivirga cuniculi TaxID=2715131 RepID=A0A4D7K4B3_9BACT|nr:hypothetical protein DCC35_05675 [Mangrovivirga cuniculi]
MFLTEFQVRNIFIGYVILFVISAALILYNKNWTFKSKLLRLIILFFLPVIGFIIIATEFLIDKISYHLLKMKGIHR